MFVCMYECVVYVFILSCFSLCVYNTAVLDGDGDHDHDDNVGGGLMCE